MPSPTGVKPKPGNHDRQPPFSISYDDPNKIISNFPHQRQRPSDSNQHAIIMPSSSAAMAEDLTPSPISDDDPAPMTQSSPMNRKPITKAGPWLRTADLRLKTEDWREQLAVLIECHTDAYATLRLP